MVVILRLMQLFLRRFHGLRLTCHQGIRPARSCRDRSVAGVVVFVVSFKVSLLPNTIQFYCLTEN